MAISAALIALVVWQLVDASSDFTMVRIVSVHTDEATSEDEAFRVAASVEAESEHPIARGIVKSAEERDFDYPAAKDFQNITGDSQAVADAVTEELGIDTVFAEVLPEDKTEKVKELQSQGKRVAMDGNQSAAARYLNIPRHVLLYRLEKFGIGGNEAASRAESTSA